MDGDEDTVNYTEAIEEFEISKIENNSQGMADESYKPLSAKRGPRRGVSDLRTPRQKFCARWEVQFPWLKPNRIDESVGYCTVCRKELVCKKSHLERHQKSFKHIRLQGFEDVCTVNVPEATSIENEKEHHDDGALEEADIEYTTIKVEPIGVRHNLHKPADQRNVNVKELRALSTPPLSREGRAQETSEYYCLPGGLTAVAATLPPKDSFDLFFESVSASVKALPPRLGAEVKSQVSQLIASFELRAICEREAREKAAAESAAHSVPLANVVAVNTTVGQITDSNELAADVTIGQQVGGQSIAHFVYEYQHK